MTDADPYDWCGLAEGWAALGDETRPVQYMEQAEAAAKEGHEWDIITFAWEELGYLDRAQRARDVSDSFDDPPIED